MSEWLSSINDQTISIGEDVEKKEPLCTVGGNADWCSHYGNNMKFPKKIKNATAYDPAIPLGGMYLIHTSMFITLFIIAKQMSE